MTRTEFARYVRVAGENAQRPSRNTRYYLSYWERAAAHSWFLSWNWAMFWLTGFWMLYRKMYAWGAVVLLMEFWLSLKAQPYMRLVASLEPAMLENGQPPEVLVEAVSMILLFGAISLVFRVLLSIFGNALYYHYAAHQLKMRPRDKGGVHLGVPLLWCAGLFLYNAWMMRELPSTASAGSSPIAQTQQTMVADKPASLGIPPVEEDVGQLVEPAAGKAAFPKEVDVPGAGRGISRPHKQVRLSRERGGNGDADIPGAKKFFGW